MVYLAAAVNPQASRLAGATLEIYLGLNTPLKRRSALCTLGVLAGDYSAAHRVGCGFGKFELRGVGAVCRPVSLASSALLAWVAVLVLWCFF